MSDERSLVIFGASGFVGRHLASRAAASWDGPTVMVTRRPLRPPAPAVTVLQSGLEDRGALLDRIPPGSAIVNLAYAASAGHDENLALADAVADICVAARAHRLVHVSTAMVVGRCRDRWITEETTCRPVTPYERTKLAVETRLRTRAADVCPLVVLRPTAVFGRGGANLRKLLHDLASRPWLENYLRGALYGARAMNLVPVETVVAAMLFAARADRVPAGETYLVGADEAPENNFRDVEQVLRRARRIAAPPLPPLRLPAGALPLVLRVAGRLSLDPRARFSSARLERAGFVAPIAFADALERYAAEPEGDTPQRLPRDPRA